MQSMTTLLTMVTAAPYLQPELLLKRDAVTCGDLRGQYSNVQAPVCVGQTSICTFSAGLQGCCDDEGCCNFYTSCNGPLAPTTCTDTYCLECPRAVPYCTKYNFYDSSAVRAYDGYACGSIDIGQFTIYGVVGSTTGDGPTSTDSMTSSQSTSASAAGYITSSAISTSSISTLTDAPGPSTPVLISPISSISPTDSTSDISSSTAMISNITSLMNSNSIVSSSQSPTLTSASLTSHTSLASTSTPTAVPKKSSAPKPGVIAGAIVGSIIGVALLTAAGYLAYRHFYGPGSTRSAGQPPMIQTHYGRSGA